MALATYLHRKAALKCQADYEAGRPTSEQDEEDHAETFVLLQILLCFFCPPLAVGLERGIDVDFIIALCLTCLVWLPGALYALYIVRKYETHPITDNYPTSPDPSPGQTRTKPKLTVDELLAPASKERKEWQYAAPRPLARARARGEMAEEKPEVEHVEDVRSMRRVPSYRTSRSRKSQSTFLPAYASPSASESDSDDPEEAPVARSRARQSRGLSDVQRGKQREEASESEVGEEDGAWERASSRARGRR